MSNGQKVSPRAAGEGVPELTPLQSAFNDGIEAAKRAIRSVESGDTPFFINAVARLCNPYGYRPVRAYSPTVDETQRRMDVVVDAAVEWHQAGREGAEWFDKAEILGNAIDALLELRQPSDAECPCGTTMDASGCPNGHDTAPTTHPAVTVDESQNLDSRHIFIESEDNEFQLGGEMQQTTSSPHVEGSPLPAQQSGLLPCPKCNDCWALQQFETDINAVPSVLCGRCGFSAPYKTWQARIDTRASDASKEYVRLRDALEQSVKLQSHYAMLLNGWDGGERSQFANADEWIARLALISQHSPKVKK